jgi:aerobic carbon-monoxide dehydrogenase large subunit
MTSPIGASLRRKEDRRLLTGRGRFLDDVQVPGLLHAIIVRSPHAHARLERFDDKVARGLPGVAAVLTLADLPECTAAVPSLVPSPAIRAYGHDALVGAETRHAGEAVAVVVADDPYRATDGAAAIQVTWRPLPAATSVAGAVAPEAPRVFPDWTDNVAGLSHGAIGDIVRGFAEADVVVEATLAFARVGGMPIEPRGVLACPDTTDDTFTVWVSTQVPYAVRSAVATALGLAETRVRIIAPDVGGGFGVKGHVYPEDVLVPAVARRLGRAVKWVETRREHLLTAAPDRDQVHTARLGLARDGRLVALETTFTRDHGAYPTLGDVITLNTINHLPGPYRIPAYQAQGTNVVTHKTFAAAYRGAGRPEAALVIDRLLDRAARDRARPGRTAPAQPDPREAMPYRTVSPIGMARSSSTILLTTCVASIFCSSASATGPGATSSTAVATRVTRSASGSRSTSRAPASVPSRAPTSASTPTAPCG